MNTMCRFVVNSFREPIPRWSDSDNAAFADPAIVAVHRAIPEYKPTPLVSLPGLAAELKLGSVQVKDESLRFGLKAFKALGASYATYQWIIQQCRQKGISAPYPSQFLQANNHPALNHVTFCTATDGNHGRGVAWVAQKLGRPARIYMPAGSVEARVEAIRSHGAEVIIVDGNYDLAVRQCMEDADKHGWQIISDTSWPGYEDIPRWINAAYTTIFREIDEQLKNSTPDIVIIPGGVGALAAAAAWYYNRPGITARPRLVCVEPLAADCLFRSIQSSDGSPVTVANSETTIMAGLNCGTPSIVAWPLIRSGFDGFVVISDDWCRTAMRTYYYPGDTDPRIISGESGAASLAALLALCRSATISAARESLSLNAHSRILLLNTEGDTDPDHFRQVVSARP